MKASRQG